MKTLMALTLLIVTSVQAGTLVNRRTGESIELNYDQDNQKIEVISHSTNANSGTFDLRALSTLQANPDYLSATHAWCTNAGESNCVMFAITPPLPITTFTFVADVLAAPFRGIAHLARNTKYRRAHRKLTRAILTNDEVRITNRIFRAAEQTINNALRVTEVHRQRTEIDLSRQQR